MTFNALSLLLLAASAVGLLLSITAWKLGKTSESKIFAFMSLAGAVYTLGYAFEISSTSLQGIMFWLRVQYLGISFMPAFLILFAIHYTGRSSWLTLPVTASFFIIPVITLFLFNTNEIHQLVYQSVELNTQGPFPVISFEKGPWYWVNVSYMGFVFLVSNTLLFLKWLRSISLYRQQTAVIIAGSIVPYAANLSSLFELNPWPLDLVPFGIGISGILFFWGLFRFQLFSLAPVARAALFEQMNDGVLAVDWYQRIVDINKLAAQYLGVSEGVVGKPVEDVLEDWPEIIEQFMERTGKNQLEVRRTMGGMPRWFEIELTPLQDPYGVHIGKMVVIREISHRKKTEQDLQASEERYRALVENANEAIVVNQEERHVFVNQMALELFGCSEEKLTSVPFFEFVHPEDREMVRERYLKRINGEIPREKYSFKIITCSGETRWVIVSAVLIEWKGKPATLSMISDITEQKQHEEQLKYLSLHDQLTGLYNRAYFEAELKRLNSGREYPITIIAADVDGLKLINDTMGHEEGDELLRSCARVLKKSLRESDILSRVGGDEFAALLPYTGERESKMVEERIRKNVALYNQNASQLPLSISIGSATAEVNSVTLKETFKEADDLMYRDKIFHRNSVRSQIMHTLLAALSERDYMKEGRIKRVYNLCWNMGEKMGLPTKQIMDLVLLAQVHDLGTVGIPDSILMKKGPLTEEEWELMRQHPEKGYRIAASSPDLAEIADLILKHHERWDGTGYPLGLKGEEIPLPCRILSVVDAFEAMTSDRPYRKTKTRQEAIGELKKCAGSQFDPEMVNLFLKVFEKEFQQERKLS